MKELAGKPKRDVRIIGHRGSMATHSGNTLAGFQHAIAVGADGVELDVAVSRDHLLVVTHDLVLADGRVVRDHCASELGLPSLDDVLAIDSPRTFWFDIEAKVDEDSPEAAVYARLLRETIERSRTRAQVMLRSFDHKILRTFHAMEPAIPLAALIPPAWEGDWVAAAREACASTIAPHYPTVDRDRVRSAHAAGIAVNVWTVNDPLNWARLASMGVDALVTDDPEAALVWRDLQPIQPQLPSARKTDCRKRAGDG